MTLPAHGATHLCRDTCNPPDVVGLNPAVLILTGVWAQDHGAFGTVHIGIGSCANLGGVTKAAAHFDGMMNRPTLRLDEQVILENGQLNIGVT
jgi:leucyl aminopeptidase (aminopeptidase T)